MGGEVGRAPLHPVELGGGEGAHVGLQEGVVGHDVGLLAADLAAKPGIDGVTIKSALQRNFPPWPHAASTDAVAARANRLYAELGRSLTPTEVGSSADANYAAETGTPVIDGFGMEGGGAHSVDDYADLATLTPRAYLLARMLMDVGHDPKGR